MIYHLKRVFLFSLALTLFLALGCSQKPTRQGYLKLNLKDDPLSFGPRLVHLLKDLSLVTQLYEGLTRLDESGSPTLALATSYEISEDGLIYTFHLREASWSDGSSITAHDFVRSWKEALSPDFASDYSFILDPIRGAHSLRRGDLSQPFGARALDDKTLQVTLERPIPYFLELLAFPTFFPVSESHLSNGPFVLKKWVPQSEVVLERSELYWDKEHVALEGIQCTILPDPMTEEYLFETQELDWIGQPLSHSMLPEILAKMRGQNRLFSSPVAGTFWLKFNTTKPPFNDARIRKAFSYAIHREQLITHVLQGGQKVATGPVTPTMSLQSDPYFEDGNSLGARELFEQACREKGITAETFPPVTLTFGASERNYKLTQLIQQQWQNVFGITVHLEPLELQVYRQQSRQGNFQVGTGDWVADFHDPIAFLERFADPSNESRWNSPPFQELLKQAAQEKDREQRRRLLHDAEKILVDEMPIAPLYHYSFDYAKQDQVQGVVLSPLGIADFKKARKK